MDGCAEPLMSRAPNNPSRLIHVILNGSNAIRSG
jgi:hypothetical protein